MTNDEARIVAAIVATADNGCAVCRDDLLELLRQKFPEVNFPVFSYYGDDLDEVLR